MFSNAWIRQRLCPSPAPNVQNLIFPEETAGPLLPTELHVRPALWPPDLREIRPLLLQSRHGASHLRSGHLISVCGKRLTYGCSLVSCHCCRRIRIVTSAQRDCSSKPQPGPVDLHETHGHMPIPRAALSSIGGSRHPHRVGVRIASNAQSEPARLQLHRSLNCMIPHEPHFHMLDNVTATDRAAPARTLTRRASLRTS